MNRAVRWGARRSGLHVSRWDGGALRCSAVYVCMYMLVCSCLRRLRFQMHGVGLVWLD